MINRSVQYSQIMQNVQDIKNFHLNSKRKSERILRNRVRIISD
jgi:hypothetical protein